MSNALWCACMLRVRARNDDFASAWISEASVTTTAEGERPLLNPEDSNGPKQLVQQNSGKAGLSHFCGADKVLIQRSGLVLLAALLSIRGAAGSAQLVLYPNPVVSGQPALG